jgi:hypothetical protein
MSGEDEREQRHSKFGLQREKDMRLEDWDQRYHTTERDILYSPGKLFQIKFEDESQFTSFPGLTIMSQGAADCVVASTVAIGMRSTKRGKPEAMKCNERNAGVHNAVTDEYYSMISGREVVTRYFELESIFGSFSDEAKWLTILDILKDLKRNHATMFVFNTPTLIHAIVCYRRSNNDLVFFDPQPSGKTSPNPPSTDLSVILGYGGVSISDVYRIGLKYFKAEGLKLERQQSSDFKLVESLENEEKRLEGRIIAARLAEEARMQALYGHLRAQMEAEEAEEAEETKEAKETVVEKAKPSKKKGKDTKKGGKRIRYRRHTNRKKWK